MARYGKETGTNPILKLLKAKRTMKRPQIEAAFSLPKLETDHNIQTLYGKMASKWQQASNRRIPQDLTRHQSRGKLLAI